MARLTAAARKALPKSDFAVPSKDGYPVDTANRARDALSRVAQFGSSAEKAQVRRKVKEEYPGIKQSKGPAAKGSATARLSRELDRRLDAKAKRRG